MIHTLDFGRHRGKAIADVPLQYLAWVLTTADLVAQLSPTLVDAIRTEVERRRGELAKPPGNLTAGGHEAIAANIEWLGKRIREAVEGDLRIPAKAAQLLAETAATAFVLARAVRALHEGEAAREQAAWHTRVAAMPSSN